MGEMKVKMEIPVPKSKRKGLCALVRGDSSLKRAFWMWGAIGGGGQIVLLSALLLALADPPGGLVGWALVGWIGFIYIYFVLVFVGVWRSAGRMLSMEGGASFAVAARMMVALGVVLAVAITVQVLFMGGSPH